MEGRRIFDRQRYFFINELIKLGYFKTSEGKQLYELSLFELEKIYFELKGEGND